MISNMMLKNILKQEKNINIFYSTQEKYFESMKNELENDKEK